MATHKFIYACIRGWTATLKVPLFYSNTGIKGTMPTMNVPPYTTIMGILGSMVGRDLDPYETKKGLISKNWKVIRLIPRRTF
jgi:CRISPR/Cas system-associated protein Cas5 (RAMP superfamily)